MLISFAKKFSKKYDKAPAHIKKATKERLKLFKQDSFHSSLNNHTLTGLYLGSRSINITGDWRAIYSENSDDEGTKTVIFEVLGTHSQLYK